MRGSVTGISSVEKDRDDGKVMRSGPAVRAQFNFVTNNNIEFTVTLDTHASLTDIDVTITPATP